MEQSQASSVSVLIAWIAAIAAIVSAIATVAMSRLTSRLAKATEDYARLMREELGLLRAQMEVPMLVGIRWVPVPNPAFDLTCEHPGSSTTLPVIIKKAVLVFEAGKEGQTIEITDEHPFDDFLKPGKTWKRQVAPKIAAEIQKAPRPNFFNVLLRAGRKRSYLGNLTVSLQYERAQKLEETSRAYEVHTALWEDVALTRVTA